MNFPLNFLYHFIHKSCFKNLLKSKRKSESKYVESIFENFKKSLYNFHTKKYLDNQSLPLPCCAVEHPECMAILTDEDDLPYKGKF
jgi:NADH:ubiquinone oxidoreductase subunit B-like Fe-S oxidoreductase